jgi:hypothetical protein
MLRVSQKSFTGVVQARFAGLSQGWAAQLQNPGQLACRLLQQFVSTKQLQALLA